jgi:hypothetical protein
MSHRLYFTVTRTGFATDGSFHLGRPIQFSLPQHLHKLDVGDQISIPIEDCPRGAVIDSRDIFIESGRYFGEAERKEFQTKGPEPLGSWTPVVGNSKYSDAAKPHDGKFFPQPLPKKA